MKVSVVELVLFLPCPLQIYKSTKCNDMQQSGSCPRGPFCAFAHIERMYDIRMGGSSLSSCSPLTSAEAQAWGPHWKLQSPGHSGADLDALIQPPGPEIDSKVHALLVIESQATLRHQMLKAT